MDGELINDPMDIFNSDMEDIFYSYPTLLGALDETRCFEIKCATSSREVPFSPCDFLTSLGQCDISDVSDSDSLQQVTTSESPVDCSTTSAHLCVHEASLGTICPSDWQMSCQQPVQAHKIDRRGDDDHIYSIIRNLDDLLDESVLKSANNAIATNCNSICTDFTSSPSSPPAAAKCNSSSSSSCSSSSSSSCSSSSSPPVSPVKKDTSSRCRAKRHLTPKIFTCKFDGCSDAFSKSSHLKVHIRKHTGEKPFHCTYSGCKWSFRRSDELSRHKRCHSGFKPYACAYCPKRFGRSDHLNKHMKIHVRASQADKLCGERESCPSAGRKMLTASLACARQMKGKSVRDTRIVANCDLQATDSHVKLT